jgi:DNA polymerase I-like protein with 3'-5' exonuclease and polymerase domains
LRCLAHYLARYDDGEYVDLVLNGDIHTANQEAAGLDTRDQAKTFIYALLYGAGDAKIGQIVGGSSRQGKQLRGKFMKNIPAYARLLKGVQAAANSRGRLKGLDGRYLHVRSAHSALNTLLQGAGAVIMKQAIVNFHGLMDHLGFTHGVEYKQVLFVHDELQVECASCYPEIVGQSLVEGMRMTAEDFDLWCPIDGEYKVGTNWAETH